VITCQHPSRSSALATDDCQPYITLSKHLYIYLDWSIEQRNVKTRSWSSSRTVDMGENMRRHRSTSGCSKLSGKFVCLSCCCLFIHDCGGSTPDCKYSGSTAFWDMDDKLGDIYDCFNPKTKLDCKGSLVFGSYETKWMVDESAFGWYGTDPNHVFDATEQE